MTKKELIRLTADSTGLKQKDVSIVVEAMLSSISNAVKNGETVALSGFGSFSLKHRKARSFHDPVTGEAKESAEKNIPSFKPAKAFCQEVSEQ